MLGSSELLRQILESAVCMCMESLIKLKLMKVQALNKEFYEGIFLT